MNCTGIQLRRILHALLLPLALSALASCAHLPGPGAAAGPDADGTVAGSGAPRERGGQRGEGAASQPRTAGVRVLSEEELAQLIAEHRREFSSFVVREVLPRVEREIPRLLEAGYADRLDRSDLYHVHIRYPRSVYVDLGLAPERLFSTVEYHLLYHTHENPYIRREEWIGRLRAYENSRIDEALDWLERQLFDYHDFFYGSGRRRGPAAVSAQTVRRYAQIWRRAAAAHGTAPPASELAARIVFLIGPGQPGYEEAYRRLFAPRAVRSYGRPESAALLAGDALFDSAYWHPATIYFTPRTSRPLFEEEPAGLRWGAFEFTVELRLPPVKGGTQK